MTTPHPPTTLHWHLDDLRPGGEVGVEAGAVQEERGKEATGVGVQERHPVYKRVQSTLGGPLGKLGKARKGGQVLCDGARPACPAFLEIGVALHL